MKVETRNSNIDVNAIMAQIKRDITAKKAKGIIGEDVDRKLVLTMRRQDMPADIKSHLREMNGLWYISGERPIESEMPYIAPIAILIKKFIRKLTQWYIDDIAEQASLFNMHAAWVMDEMKDKIIALEDRIASLEEDSGEPKEASRNK